MFKGLLTDSALARSFRDKFLSYTTSVISFQTLIYFYLVGFPIHWPTPLTKASELKSPFGLTLLHDKLYWTDRSTVAVYRADVNTGANIVLMTGNLGEPMDIHAYSDIPKQRKCVYYILQQYNPQYSTIIGFHCTTSCRGLCFNCCI